MLYIQNNFHTSQIIEKKVVEIFLNNFIAHCIERGLFLMREKGWAIVLKKRESEDGTLKPLVIF